MAVTARGWVSASRSSSDLDNMKGWPQLSGSPLGGTSIRTPSLSSRSLNQSKPRTSSVLDRESYKCLAFLLNSLDRRPQHVPTSLERTAGSVLRYLASPPSRRRDTWKYSTSSADLTTRDDSNALDLDSLDYSDSDMASATSSSRSSRLPSEAFHMSTRRRAKLGNATPTNFSALPEVLQKTTPGPIKRPAAKPRKSRATKARPATSNLKSGVAASTKTENVLSDSSPPDATLSSIPMSRDPPSLVPSLSTSSRSFTPTLPSTPEPVVAISPSLKRKTRSQTPEDKAAEAANLPSTRAKRISYASLAGIVSRKPTPPSPSLKRKTRSQPSKPDDVDIEPLAKRSKAALKPAKSSGEDHAVEEIAEPVEEEEIDWLHPKNPIFYDAYGRPQDTTASNDPPSGTGSPARKARGGGNGKKRGGFGGTGGRGRGGRARGGGRAGRNGGDSPERKTVLGPEAKETIAGLKARQQELKKLFGVVGDYQADLLDSMLNRDLSKLIRKPGAHKKVPEYEEVLEELDDAKEKADAITRERYRVTFEAEKRRFEGEKAIIERRYRATVEGARGEHLQGAEGDIETLRNIQASFDDDGRSVVEEDEEELPRFNKVHEPDNPVRGYYSSRITDETSLRHLYTTNKVAPLSNDHADQARREVIDEDVLSPIKTAFFEKIRAERELKARKRTENIDELSQVGTDELRKLNAYLLPRGMTSDELNSWALSTLADVSEWKAQKHPKNMYTLMKLPPGETLPADTYSMGPPPGSRGGDKTSTSLASSSALPLPPPHSAGGSVASQPRQQFIFQQQQSQQLQPQRARSSFSSNPAAAAATATTPATPAPVSSSTTTTNHTQPPTRPLIPVTFVNATVASTAVKRRGNNSSNNSNSNNNAGNGAAGGAGAAVAPGQRVLLPKGYVGLPRG